MKTLRFAIILLATLCIAYIVYTANTGGSFGLFSLGLKLPYGDKLGHFSLFGAFTFVLILGSNFHQSKYKSTQFYTVLPFVIAAITLEEFSQIFIERRNFDLLDLAADGLGLLAAVKLAQKVAQYWVKLKSTTT